jgi:hypothetical protein
MKRQILTLDLQGIGWKSSCQIKHGTTRVSIKKEVAVGLEIKKGQTAFGYLARCLRSNRHVVIFFPDGEEKNSRDDDERE